MGRADGFAFIGAGLSVKKLAQSAPGLQYCLLSLVVNMPSLVIYLSAKAGKLAAKIFAWPANRGRRG
jgi:hypothetical protein